MTENIQSPGRTLEFLYLNRDQTGDVTFLVESQRIRAHRCILAAISPKYKAQFYGLHSDEGEIRVVNVSAAAFNVFLQFFYKEPVDLTIDNIEAVFDLAQQSLVDGFIESCAEFLSKVIKDNRFSLPYRLANLYGLESLCLECERRISSHTIDIFATDDFVQWDRDMLLYILKLNSLNCTEKYLFYACISWAREQCERNNLDPEQLENVRTALGDVIYQIRFSSFTAEQFAELLQSFEGLFTSTELHELVYLTGKLKHFTPKMFNPIERTLRCEPKAQTVAWTQECNRFMRINMLPGKIDVIGPSKFSFTSAKPIRLHGFALGMHFKDASARNFPMSVSLGGGLAVLRPNFKVYQNQTRKNETMIIFEKPIEKVTNFACSITLPFKRLNYEFVLRSDVNSRTSGDWTAFDFGGDKWVTRLFYDL